MKKKLNLAPFAAVAVLLTFALPSLAQASGLSCQVFAPSHSTETDFTQSLAQFSGLANSGDQVLWSDGNLQYVVSIAKDGSLSLKTIDLAQQIILDSADGDAKKKISLITQNPRRYVTCTIQ